MKFKALINRYSLPIYFFFAYTIAWGGILLIAATKAFDPHAIEMTDGV
jgi:hypothetical protein